MMADPVLRGPESPGWGDVAAWLLRHPPDWSVIAAARVFSAAVAEAEAARRRGRLRAVS
jgi:hypothetical protein